MNVKNKSISTDARRRAAALLETLSVEEKLRQLGCTTLSGCEEPLFVLIKAEFIRVQYTYLFDYVAEAIRCTEVNLCFSFCTGFSSYNNNTVGTTCTVDCCGRSIF